MKHKSIPRSWYYAIAGFLLLAIGNHLVVDWITRHTPSSKVYWLTQETPQQTDYVVLGSSAALASIDPAALAKELGADVLMLAEEGAALPEQALIWKLFLERHRTKFLLLEVDAWGLTDQGYSWPFHEYHYLPFLQHPPIEQAMTEQKGPWLTTAWKYLPMLKFAQFNSKFGAVQLGSWLKQTRFDPRHSGVNHGVAAPEDLEKLARTELFAGWHWDESRIKALDDLLANAEQHGVRTILYYAPIYQGCRVAEEQKIVARYREIAARRKVPLLMIDNPVIVAQPANFKDPTHLNATGAALFTKAIAERLRPEQTEEGQNAK